MKKIIMIVFLLGIGNIQAQNYSGEGDQRIQVGTSFYGYGNGIKATYDYGLTDLFSVGGGVTFIFNGNYQNDFFIYGRGDVHLNNALNLPENMDLYPGLELGLLTSNSFGLHGHIGFRYLFSDNLGAFIELGTNGSVGLVFKL
jgi:hypothetical protein